MMKELFIFGIWIFNITWFYFSNEIPSPTEALIIINLLILSFLIVCAEEVRE